jgi:hypothetical protein
MSGEEQCLDKFLFLSEHPMHNLNLSLNFPSDIAMDIVGTERIDNVFELPDLHEQVLCLLRDVIDLVVNESLLNDSVEHVEMKQWELVKLLFGHSHSNVCDLFLNNSVEQETLESVQVDLDKMPSCKELMKK